MGLGTSGPAMVHCVKRGDYVLKMQHKVQANGDRAWVFELDGHGSAGLAANEEWLPHMV